MKFALIALVLGFSSMGHAGILPAASTLPSLAKAMDLDLSVQAAGRKGSHRVGGSGRSGKGGRYVGGR
jgi:hypothetical protein